MDEITNKRYDKALKSFTPQFIADTSTDILTNHVFNQVLNGNAYRVIEQLTKRCNDQQQTIDNLVAIYGPNYKDLVNTS